MKATATRTGKFQHSVAIGDHRLVTDESSELGGQNEGPSPLEMLAGSLASCTATTVEMYADRKGWDIGDIAVSVNYEPAKRGAPTRFAISMKLSDHLSQDQVQRLSEIAAKCPVHRTLEGEVMFEETISLA